eukprot:1387358-Pyramimonas_sp.AAC.1
MAGVSLSAGVQRGRSSPVSPLPVLAFQSGSPQTAPRQRGVKVYHPCSQKRHVPPHEVVAAGA